MDKKTLYEKTEKALNQAFEMAKHSVKIVSEKAGEAARVSRLLIEKATLEHHVSKKFAEIGNVVFEKIGEDKQEISVNDSQLKGLISETKRLEKKLARVERSLKQARETKKQDQE